MRYHLGDYALGCSAQARVCMCMCIADTDALACGRADTVARWCMCDAMAYLRETPLAGIALMEPDIDIDNYTSHSLRIGSSTHLFISLQFS